MLKRTTDQPLLFLVVFLFVAVACGPSSNPTVFGTSTGSPLAMLTSQAVTPTATPISVVPTLRPARTPIPTAVPTSTLVPTALPSRTATPLPDVTPTLVPSPTPVTLPTPVPVIAGRNQPVGPFPGDLEWLHIEGNKIINESGDVVTLRGANVENWQWSWDSELPLTEILSYELSAIPVLTSSSLGGWSANVIHIDVAAKPIIDNNTKYLAALDTMVALAKSNGAYTVMSMRYEDIDNEPIYPTQLIEDGIAVLAGRYSNEPAVLYVLGSEPREISWSNLKPSLTTMLDALRANNPRAIGFLPGTEWSRYVFQALDDPIERENVAFQVDTFDKWNIVLNGDGFFRPLRLDEVAQKYPVLIGGFGPYENPPSGNFWMTDYEDLVQFADYLEANGISWTAWLFNDVGCPCLLEQPRTSFIPTDWGAYLQNIMQQHAN
jgi:hypothetical protein